MEIYQLYILISILLIVAELFVPGFIMLPLGVAGLVTSLVAYFRPEVWLHAVFFVCGSGFALLALARFRNSLKQHAETGAGGEGLVGQVGSVVELPSDAQPMKVKIYGDLWDVVDGSLSTQELSQLNIGSKVKVKSVAGNKITIEHF